LPNLSNSGIDFSITHENGIMAINNENTERGDRDMTNNRLEGRSSLPGDLPDSKEDSEKLGSEETFIDLPDVKDIPGQEFVNAPPLGSLGDTTIASDDEEGVGVFGREDEASNRGTDFNVSRDERAALEDSEYMPTRDENNLRRARMDNTDFQNEPLNEKSFGEETSGEDLDVANESEDINEGDEDYDDEENQNYSLGSSDNDNVVEGTP
jgi:hypothetical protein